MAGEHELNMKKRRGYNPKRCLAPTAHWPRQVLDELVQHVSYGGNPEHKSRPGDFGLHPPTNPRPGKTLCDKVREFSKADALELVRAGMRRCMVSVQQRGRWPQNVWSVHDDEPFEAQLENQERGVYHGYPMPSDDDFGLMIIEEWKRRG
jgi:hypothetical protein